MPDIHHSIRIAAAPETIFPLVATGEGFTKWWAADVVNSGPAVELGFFNRATIYRLLLHTGQPPLQVEWICETGKEWAGTTLIFHMETQDSAALLYFSHIGWEAETDYFKSCTKTWGDLMVRLKAAAEGKSSGPLFLAGGMAY